MSEAAQNYFKTYYKLQRLIDEEKSSSSEADDLREQLKEVRDEMTDNEKELLDIVDKNIEE